MPGVTITTDETSVTFQDPSEPSTNFAKISTTEQSLFEKGLLVGGGMFDVDAVGTVRSVLMRGLTAAEETALPVNSLYMKGGHLYFKLSSGPFGITN